MSLKNLIENTVTVEQLECAIAATDELIMSDSQGAVTASSVLRLVLKAKLGALPYAEPNDPVFGEPPCEDGPDLWAGVDFGAEEDKSHENQA